MAERRSATLRARSWMTIIALGTLGAGCTPMDNLLAGVFGRSMRSQPSLGTYENPMAPPVGTVPFAAGNFPAGPGVVNLGQPEGAIVPPPATVLQLLQQAPEIVEMVNPVAASPASLARGQQVFERACTPCHGSGGLGDGPVTQAGVPSWSLLQPSATGLADGYIYTIIRIGRGAMPAYGHQISHYDRWHVVNYVRQLQGQ